MLKANNKQNNHILLRVNYLYVLICVVFMSVFNIAFGVFNTFVSLPNTEESFMEFGEKRYTIKDNLYDADEFADSLNNPVMINKLSDFYNSMSDSELWKIISAFDQQIEIENFKGGKSFYYNSDEYLETHKDVQPSIKSLQINRTGYEFYGLQVICGNEIDWDGINYNDDVPILLGYNYKKIYDIGDIIKVKFYFRQLNLRVEGFLESNSNMLYKTQADFSLDDYIVIPYPDKLWHIDLDNIDDSEFDRILFFSIVNCDLVTNENERSVIHEIKRISDATDFTNFIIIGVNTLLLNNIDTVAFAIEYKNIINIILLFSYCIIWVILFILVKRNLREYCCTSILRNETIETGKFFRLHSLLFFPGLGIALLVQYYLFKRFYMNIFIIQLIVTFLTYSSIMFIISLRYNKSK